MSNPMESFKSNDDQNEKVESDASVVKNSNLFRNIGIWILGIVVAGNVLFEITTLFLIGSDRNAGYAAFVALGSVIALPVIWAYRKYAGLSWVDCALLWLIAKFGIIYGARLFHVVQFWEDFADKSIAYMLDLRMGGMVLYGGHIVALLLILLYAKCRKKSSLAVLDVMAAAFAVMSVFIAGGCMVHGCCQSVRMIRLVVYSLLATASLIALTKLKRRGIIFGVTLAVYILIAVAGNIILR